VGQYAPSRAKEGVAGGVAEGCGGGLWLLKGKRFYFYRLDYVPTAGTHPLGETHRYPRGGEVRKPRNFKLGDQHGHELEVGAAGQKILYLKPSKETFLYINGRNLRRLKAWLSKAEEWRNL
jgi:hypothetical protein